MNGQVSRSWLEDWKSWCIRNIRKDIATCQVASILPINFHGEKHGEEKQKAKTLNNRTAWEQRIPNTRRNDRHGKKKERTNGSKGGNGEKKTGRNTEQPPLRHSTTNQSPGDPGMLELPIRSSTRFRNKNGTWFVELENSIRLIMESARHHRLAQPGA